VTPLVIPANGRRSADGHAGQKPPVRSVLKSAAAFYARGVGLSSSRARGRPPLDAVSRKEEIMIRVYVWTYRLGLLGALVLASGAGYKWN
jgi:hypothetical protein